jgi:hypothetical protein
VVYVLGLGGGVWVVCHLGDGCLQWLRLGRLVHLEWLGWALGGVGLSVCIDTRRRGCGIGNEVVRGGALCSVGTAFGGVVCVGRWLALG